MDNDISNPETESFGKTLAKDFTRNMIGTAGMLAGVIVVGAVLNARAARKEKRESEATPAS